jgi:hypothetical protein
VLLCLPKDQHVKYNRLVHIAGLPLEEQICAGFLVPNSTEDDWLAGLDPLSSSAVEQRRAVCTTLIDDIPESEPSGVCWTSTCDFISSVIALRDDLGVVSVNAQRYVTVLSVAFGCALFPSVHEHLDAFLQRQT